MTEYELTKTQVDAQCGCKFEVWYDVMCPGMTVFRKSEVKFLCTDHHLQSRGNLQIYLSQKCDYFTILQNKKKELEK